MAKEDVSQTELNQMIFRALNAAPMSVSEAVWELVSRCIPAEKRRIAETQGGGKHSFMIPWAFLLGNPMAVGYVRSFLLSMQPEKHPPIVICGKAHENDIQYTIRDMEGTFPILIGLPVEKSKVIFSRDEPEKNWKMNFQAAVK